MDADCAFHLVELLQDESDAVAVKSANVIALMTDHSAPAKAKLHNGPLIGLENSVSKALLNPIQGEFTDAGAIPLLVAWLPLPIPQKTDAALQALTTLSSYNHEGKVAYLEALVDVIASGQAYQCLEHLDDLIDSLQSNFSSSNIDDTVLQLYEKVSISVIQAIRNIPDHIGEKAVAVLGTLCEHAPELAKELRKGTLATDNTSSGNTGDVANLVTKHLLFGSIQAQDTAARTLWYLTLGDKDILGPEGQLAPQIEALAGVLRALVERSQKDEDEEDERRDDVLRRSGLDYNDQDQRDYSENIEGARGYHSRGSSYGGGGGGGGLGAAAGGFGPLVEEVCFAEEAQQLLKALIVCNPELNIESSESIDKGTSCCIM